MGCWAASSIRKSSKDYNKYNINYLDSTPLAFILSRVSLNGKKAIASILESGKQTYIEMGIGNWLVQRGRNNYSLRILYSPCFQEPFLLLVEELIGYFCRDALAIVCDRIT